LSYNLFLGHIFEWLLHNYCTLSNIVIYTHSWYYICVVFPILGNQKGGANMRQELIYLLKSIVASIIAYYICKWLDRFFKDN